MTFEQLLVFHKIVHLGSFRSAADELRKTQPAISLSIKKLEDELGAALFDRTGYRPILTKHGRVFYEKSTKVVQSMQDLEQLAQSFRNQEEPELTLAVDGISPLPRLLTKIKEFGEQFPNTKIILSFETLSQAERRVLEREVDLAITHFLSDTQATEVKTITEVTMVPVMSRDLFEKIDVYSQEQLLDIEQIVVSDKSPRKGASFGLLEGGRKWRLLDSNFKREIILAGLGWGHLPEHTISQELAEKKLVVLEFEDIRPRVLPIRLVRLKRNQFGPVALALWKALSDL